MYLRGGRQRGRAQADSGIELWKFPLAKATTGGAIRRA
jgi:hypothetical protein